MDLTLDGVPEILIGCQASELTDLVNGEIFGRNRILRRPVGEPPHMLPTGTYPAFEDEGCTLALAQVDLEDNGLSDLVVVNDTFSTVFHRQTELPPGYFLRRCSPNEACTAEELRMAPDIVAWGSFMGAAELRVRGERAWYITDWGPNRLLHFREGRFVDVAPERAAELGDREGWLLFAWSALTDDFSGDGHDELFVSQGDVRLAQGEAQQAHMDGILQLTPSGTFAFHTEAAGFPEAPLERDRDGRYRSSSRAAARADLNLDGRLELVVLDYNGSPQVYREMVAADRPLRCNVDPVSRLVPTVGTGFAFAPEGSRDFRTWDIQGQMRFGLPSRLLLPWQRGTLRFPSGAELRWDCDGRAGPIPLVEPDWLQVEAAGSNVTLRIDAPWLFREADIASIAVHFLADDPADPLALHSVSHTETRLSHDALTEGWVIPRPADADTLMLQLEGRWVPRRFALHF